MSEAFRIISDALKRFNANNLFHSSKGMWSMLQQKSPEDFVLATGETHSVRQFVQLSFQEIGKEIVWEGENEAEVGKDKETGAVLVKVKKKIEGVSIGFSLTST